MVTVYTTYSCPRCDMTKRYLTGEGIEFEAINVEENPKAKEHVKNVLGFTSMPVVVAEGMEPFTGFDPSKLEQLKK